MIDSENQIDLLLNGSIKEFNRYVEQGILIHLPYAKLSHINANQIILTNGFLFSVELIKADLTGAKLNRSDLTGAKLNGAKLSESDFSDAILINTILQGIDNMENANFKDVITDNYDFIDFLRKTHNIQNFPNKINSKQELKSKLEEKGIDGADVYYYLKYSKLPNTQQNK